MATALKSCITALLAATLVAPLASAQSQSDEPPTLGGDFKKTIADIVKDQGMIWSSPFHIKKSDAAWLIPFAGITTGLLVTDRRTSHELTRHSHIGTASTFSDAGLIGLAGISGGMYLLSLRNGDYHQRETGRLALEAAADGFVVDEGLKYAFRRERPDVDFGRGRFFTGISSSSFPSGHATMSFAMAAVIADEYPGWLSKTLAYGLAGSVSLARVAGQKHFPADVFVGGTAGYLIGHNVYKRRHNEDLNIGTFIPGPEQLSAPRMSSTYIELDSWIYPAIERLTALGVVQTSFLGIRPWTRMSVYGMLARAHDDNLSPEAESLVDGVRRELSREEQLDQQGATNQAIGVDEIYTRFQYISGTPLNDSFHFGQTIINDFGRPYGEGLQQLDGFIARAEKGRFSFFARGEYQHAPSVPGYPAAVNQYFAVIDNIPGETFPGSATRDQFRLLDTYVSFNLLSNEFSVGKQSYWWSPDQSTALLIGDNAEPFYALRINRTIPLRIPLLSYIIGSIRYDNFFGQTQGNLAPHNPFIYGNKISLHPTENFEIGFSRDAVFAGGGLEPLTLHTFWNSFTSFTSGTKPGFNPHDTPGSRHANFDFRYRLPFVRDLVTLYTDSLSHDDPSPIAAPRRAAVMSGLYFSRLPHLPKLDLHVEGGTTDTVTDRAKAGQFYYFEQALYRDSYRIKGKLLGAYIGREGTGGQAWSTWWFDPQSTLTLGFRTVKVSQLFIPEGETQQDVYGELKYRWKSGLGVELLLQDERWVAPFLAAGPQNNFTSRFQLSFEPKNWRLTR